MDGDRFTPGQPAAVDAQRPWLGLDSFSEATRSYFHGREEEVAELARRVQRKLLTVLFGQSGLGKTSILRAGIVPLLRTQGYCPVYVRVDYGPDAPPADRQIKQAIMQATAASGHWSQAGVASADESLWEFLHHRDDVLTGADGTPVLPLLIFDQFEEMFTLAQLDDDGRRRAAAFIDSLAELVENRPSAALEARLEEDDTAIDRFDFARTDYRVLIALREDYLAHLEGLKAAMPSITQNRMRLAPMTGEQALAAVRGPGGALVDDEVAQAIVRFVAGGAELAHAQVEPSLLSLICRELNDKRIAAARATITLDLLAGSHASILSDFYERALADQPSAVRCIIEDHLLTESGYRENVAAERVLAAFAAAGAAPGALAILVDRRLLRIEERLDVRRVELTHDVLCGVVSASAALRHEREALEASERQRAEDAELALQTRRQLKRARQMVLVCGLLTAGAIGGAAYGYASAQRAQQAEQTAAATRDVSQQARGQAENLVSFLLEDFQAELEPQGRLELLASIAERAVRYYDALPASALTPESERNRATAQMRLGGARERLGQLDSAIPTLDQAIATLRRLHAGGDNSERTLTSLALALTWRSNTHTVKGEFAEARALSDEAVRACAAAAPQIQSLPSMQRTRALAATRLGYAQRKLRQFEAALASLDEARALLRPYANTSPANVAAASLYLDAAGWSVAVLADMDRFAEANTRGADAMTLANQLVASHPSRRDAITARAMLAGIQVEALGSKGEQAPGERLRLSRISSTDHTKIMEGDPNNSRVQLNLQVDKKFIAQALYALGQVRAALKAGQEATAWPDQVKMTPLAAGNLTNSASDNALWATELGDDGQASEHVRLAHSLLKHKQAFKGRAAVDTQAYQSTLDANLAIIRGDLKEAERMLTAVIDGKANYTESYPVDFAQFRLGQLALRRQDYPAVAAHAKAVDLKEWFRRDVAEVQTLHAIGLAGQGRHAAALDMLKSVFELHRKLQLKGDASYQFEYAQALYARALAEPAHAAGLLAQALHEIDTLAPEMRGTRSVVLWRGWMQKEASHGR
ncbi:MAG: hypothetical protein V4463_07060 [Pseudomonadota bacterium]